jgi:hypothetical protein
VARIDDRELVARLRQRTLQAISATEAADEDRSEAFRQFFCEPTGTEEDDYSTFQSADVKAVGTAIFANMSISFGVDQVVQFEANSAEDEQRATAETRAVNKILEENNFAQEMTAAAQNAYLCGNGYGKVWWDEDVNAFPMVYEAIDPEDVPILTEAEPGKERRLISYDKDKRRARIEVTETKRRLRVRTVANERFFIDPDWDERSLDGCSLCGEIHFKTRDELSRMGAPWSKVKQLKAVSIADTELPFRNTGRMAGAVDPVVMQQEIVRVFEVYARYTRDEDDSRSYLFKNWLGEAGDFFLLEPEAVGRVPYAVGVFQPVANRHQGAAIAADMAQIQSSKTEAVRQWFSNVKNCSWGRIGVVTGASNADDVGRPRPGGVIRIKNPDAIVPIPVADVGPSLQILLTQIDKQRSELGGTALDMSAAPMQIANASAHATERVFSAQECGVSYDLRNFAATFCADVFVMAHAELRSGQGGPINLKIAEQWTQEDPKQWQERKWCTVNVAPSFGERVHMSNALAMCLQWDMGLLQAGLEGTLITLPGLYKKMTDWLRLNLIASPESYYIDPLSKQAQQAGQQKAQQAQQQAQQQTQVIMAIEQLKAQVEQYKTDTETQFKYYDATLDASVKLGQGETQGAVDVVRARADAEIARRSQARSVEGNSNGAGHGGAGGSGGKAAKSSNGNGSRKPATRN